MPLDAATVLNELWANPLDFLRHFHLSIAGGDNTVPSGEATFVYSDLNNTVSGFTTGLSGLVGKTKDRPQIRFTLRPGPAKEDPDIGADEFNAHYVAMKQIDDQPQTTHYALPDDGPDLMLTSQLSGCTFGIGSAANGARLVSHIQRGEGFTAVDQHDAVTGGLVHGVDRVFERQSDRTYGDARNRATVIGLRANGGWRFYAQVYRGALFGNDLIEARRLC